MSGKLGIACVLATLALAAGCAVGPRYERPAATAPTATVPTAWKTTPPWEQAAPKDAIDKGAWWKIFKDPALDGYEKQLLEANQSLAVAQQQLEQARALARVATSGFFPQIWADPSYMQQHAGANRPLNGSTVPLTSYSQNVFQIPFNVSYEADLFGRVRRNLEAANASLQANAADLGNVQLVLTAELAADYFSLRELDAELRVVVESVGYQRKGLELVNRRHEGGIASGLEVAQQAALLDATLSQVALVRQLRAQYEHAIAVLVGQPASNFTIAAAPLDTLPPPVPLGMPSDLLERRPDIAAAERQVAYANAQVGVAQAAFYPHITLGGVGGLDSSAISTLFSAPSLAWSLGGDVLQPLVEGGRNRANLDAARAAYTGTVAGYRQSVLSAFQQVEDGVSNLQTLSEASATQSAAVEEARRELAIANDRYVGGVTTYLDVITAQSTLLANERLSVQLLGQRMVATVYLVKALGGGWDASGLGQQQEHPQAIQILRR